MIFAHPNANFQSVFPPSPPASILPPVSPGETPLPVPPHPLPIPPTPNPSPDPDPPDPSPKALSTPSPISHTAIAFSKYGLLSVGSPWCASSGFWLIKLANMLRLDASSEWNAVGESTEGSCGCLEADSEVLGAAEGGRVAESREGWVEVEEWVEVWVEEEEEEDVCRGLYSREGFG
jgi:hypothetical protein